MNNEEKILALLENMQERQTKTDQLLETLVTKVDALEAGQAKLTTDVSDLKAGQAKLEAGQAAIQESLGEIRDQLEDIEAKNATQHVRTRSAIERLGKTVAQNTSDIERLKAAQ